MTSRTKILNAARQLFQENGFHQASMLELAKSAQVSVGQIYRLFECKSDIILAIADEESQRRLAAVRILGEEIATIKRAEDFEETLLPFITNGIAAIDDALIYEVMAEAHRNPTIAKTISDTCVEIRAVLKSIARLVNPKATDQALNYAEEFLMSVFFGLGHRNLTQPRLSVKEAAKGTTKLILAALRAK